MDDFDKMDMEDEEEELKDIDPDAIGEDDDLEKFDDEEEGSGDEY